MDHVPLTNGVQSTIHTSSRSQLPPLETQQRTSAPQRSDSLATSPIASPTTSKHYNAGPLDNEDTFSPKWPQQDDG
jgi:hypothetical protein